MQHIAHLICIKEHPSYTFNPRTDKGDEILLKSIEDELKNPDLSDGYKEKLKIRTAEKLYPGVYAVLNNAVAIGLRIDQGCKVIKKVLIHMKLKLSTRPKQN